MKKHNIQITDEQENAFQYMGGEKKNYSYTARTRTPLAAFCGICDSFSARIWFDYPKESDTWKKKPANSTY